MKIKEIKINQSQNIWATLLDYLWKNNKNLFNELSKYIKEIETEQKVVYTEIGKRFRNGGLNEKQT